MPQEFPSSDPFHEIEACDGYHVSHVSLGPVEVVTVSVYSGGALLSQPLPGFESTVTLAEYHKATPTDRGTCTRLHLVLDAVARYFTTGGTWEQFSLALDRMKRVIPGGLTFPGYHLTDSYSTTAGDYQHIFTSDNGTDDAVLWEEPTHNASGSPIGGFIEKTTLTKLREQEDALEAEPDDTTEEREEYAGAAWQPRRLQLPAGPSDQGPAAIEGGDLAGVPPR